MILLILLILLLIFSVFFVIRLVYDRNWSRGLQVRLNFADRELREGESTLLLEEISNRKKLPLPALEIDFNLDRGLRFINSANSLVSDKLYRRDIFALASSQRITRRLELSCIRRGYYRIDSVGITAKDIFLSKKYVGSFPQDTALHVCPERISTEKISVPYNRIMGELLSRSRVFEDPFEFGGIRDYMSSDPMKYINWKASAKTAELVVNIHDSTLSQRVCILLDTAGNFFGSEELLSEEAIRIACGLAERISAEGVSLDIIGNGKDILTEEPFEAHGITVSSLPELARSFARLKLKEEDMAPLMAQLQPDRRCLYVLISKNRSEETLRELYRLSGTSRALWIFPYMNEFKDADHDPGRVELIPWAADDREGGAG